MIARHGGYTDVELSRFAGEGAVTTGESNCVVAGDWRVGSRARTLSAHRKPPRWVETEKVVARWYHRMSHGGSKSQATGVRRA